MNNQVHFIGFTGKAPQLLNFPDSDNRVAKFSIAVKEYSSKNENQEPLWIHVDAWNGLADRVMAIVASGREVAISGKFAMVDYEKEINGVKVTLQKPLVKLSGFHLCGPKPKEETSTKNRKSSRMPAA